MPRLTVEDWRARGEAYHEASQHLLLAWTDDPKEIAQGQFVSTILEVWSKKCFDQADDMVDRQPAL